MRVLILLSHTPNPRAMKRIKLLNDNHIKLFLIYAKRTKDINFLFDLPDNVQFKEIVYNNINFIVRLFSLVKFMLIAIRAISKYKPNMIHLTNLDMLICAWIFKRIYNRGVKIIYEIADIPELLITNTGTRISRLIKRVEKYLTQSIYKLVLTSPKYWDEYYSGFLPIGKFFYMPNVPSKKTFLEYKKTFHGDQMVVGFIGFIRYLEPLKILISAAKELDNISLFFAGEGLALNAIKQHANDIGATNVTFNGPYNYDRDIVKLYSEIDVVYSAYDNTSRNSQIALPNRLYEGIICELPIIVAENTYLCDVVKKMGVGISVDPFSKEAVKEALQAMKKPAIYENLVDGCIRHKHDCYLEDYNDKLIKMYA